MITLTQLSPSTLRKAADIQEKIQNLQKELDHILGADGVSSPSTVVSSRRGRRKLSAAGLANIRAAQKARWAARRAESVTSAKSESKAAVKPAKKPVSEARLKALAKAREARWGKVRSAKKAKG